MKFNTIHSLGSRCQNSEILKHYNLREFSGFFDFMNTQTIETLNHIISDDFKEILKKENNITLDFDKATFDPETGEMLATSKRTTNKFYNKTEDIDYAIFPHHDLNNEKDLRHFINCKERFKKLINFNTLLNYSYNTWENNPSLTELEELVDNLKKIHGFKTFKVCFIAINKNNLNYGFYKKISSEFYDIWELNIHPNSFTGGLFSNSIDNQNYKNIIMSYDIEHNRITKEKIDTL
jgi:hypothetical protein